MIDTARRDIASARRAARRLAASLEQQVNGLGTGLLALGSDLGGLIADTHGLTLQAAQRTAALEAEGAHLDVTIAELIARADTAETRLTGLDGGAATALSRLGSLDRLTAALAADQAAQALRLGSAETSLAAIAAWEALVNARLGVLPVFVSADTLTVAGLRATYPAVDHIGKYARVGDLFGDLTSTMIAEKSGTLSYWRPTRTDYAKTVAMGSLGTTLFPLTSAPSLRLTGVGASASRTLSADGAWPGYEREIVAQGLLSGAVLTLLNGAGATLATVSALLGLRVRLRFDGSDYYQVA